MKIDIREDHYKCHGCGVEEKFSAKPVHVFCKEHERCGEVKWPDAVYIYADEIAVQRWYEGDRDPIHGSRRYIPDPTPDGCVQLRELLENGYCIRSLDSGTAFKWWTPDPGALAAGAFTDFTSAWRAASEHYRKEQGDA